MPDDARIVRTEGSRAVQGCLVGAVVLFVLLLGVMIVLGYQQFREHTDGPAATPGAVSFGSSGLGPLAVAGAGCRPGLTPGCVAVRAGPPGIVPLFLSLAPDPAEPRAWRTRFLAAPLPVSAPHA